LPAQNGTAPGELKLTWSAQNPNLRCMVQRAVQAPVVWVGMSGWLEKGVYQFTDRGRDAAAVYFYRLLVIDERRRQNKTFKTLSG